MDLDKLLGEETVSETSETVEKAIPEVKSEVVTVEQTEKKPKKKGKPRGGNSPIIGNNGYDLEAGDNAKFLRVNMVLFNMEKIDLQDVEAVENRLNEFFELYYSNDMKPTVAGMAMSLGMSRQNLWAIIHDAPTGGAGYKTALPPSVADTIKKAHFLLENLWESYMNSGKVNPVAGIFLGKNNFGYQDKTEYVLTPNTNQDNDYSAEDIRARYINSAEPKRLSTINSDEDQND